MKHCAECRHFQRHRPLTQVLAGELGAVRQTAASELSRLMQDERQRQDAEATMQVELMRTDQLEWPHPPSMTDCCALRAGESVFLVARLKNIAGDCSDFEPGPGETGESCATCRHRVDGEGPAHDQAMLDYLQENAELASVAGRSAAGELSSYLTTVDSRQALEIAQAYYHGRLVMGAPRYLAHCRKFSQPGAFVPCAVQNPHDRCSGWEPDASGTGPQQGLFVAAAAKKGQR